MVFMLTQLSKHTWLFPHHPDPRVVQSSVGLIATQESSLLIDTGNSPQLAKKIKAEITRNNLPPASHIIYTHHHWDHTFRACEFNVPVTAHIKCKVLLEEESRKPWSIEYLNQEIKGNPKRRVSFTALAESVDDWESFRIVVPEQVFEKEKVIDWDGLTIKLEHVGGKHSPDSIVIKVPQDGVMFIGDCYYPPPLHLRKPGSKPSMNMLSRLQDDGYDLYVEGHAKPFTETRLLNKLQKMNR